ncbi:sensor histidine kinase [Cohnella soli]|uniref:histidine kinase n=1 Tax=Cohnella soli TaxID=425005 RepID=A0ABW0HKQ5_9BACL
MRFKLAAGVAAILVPLIALLNFNQYYAAQVVRKQVAESNQTYISLYMNQIDGILEEIDSFLIGMIVSDSSLPLLDKLQSEEEAALLKVQLSKQLTNEIVRYGTMDEFFIYSAIDNSLIESFSLHPSYSERVAVGEEIVRLLSLSSTKSPLKERNWIIREIDGSYYIMRLLQAERNTYVGAWVKADSLLVPLKLIDLGESGLSLFATTEGKPMMHTAFIRDNEIDLSFADGGYSLSGKPERYLTVGALSKHGDFRLAALIPEQKILKGLFNLREWNTVVSVGSILLLPLSLLLLRRTILLPIRRLLAAMKRIGEGHMQGIPESSSSTEEFRVVNDNFNHMLSQIRELKIHVYEEQLSKQQAELRQLQTTINPHFYLNSLNIMHSLATVGDYELIQEMSRCLADYFRYIFRSSASFVSLGDELMHTRNYIRIQELRFPGQLSSEIEVPSYLLELAVPSLVIQTFVENAVKHAFSLEKPFRLTLRGKLESDGSEPRLVLVIEDTGSGFPQEVLESLAEGRSLERKDGSRHGLWNARRRLELLYERHADLKLANRDSGGARVEIRLPIKPFPKGEDDNDAERVNRR